MHENIEREWRWESWYGTKFQSLFKTYNSCSKHNKASKSANYILWICPLYFLLWRIYVIMWSWRLKPSSSHLLLLFHLFPSTHSSNDKYMKLMYLTTNLIYTCVYFYLFNTRLVLKFGAKFLVWAENPRQLGLILIDLVCFKVFSFI